jgi:predicted nucleic acid-binding protein
MVDSIDSQKVPAANEGKALDEAVWQLRMANNASREQRAAAKRLIAAKCLSIMVSAATMLLWGGHVRV